MAVIKNPTELDTPVNYVATLAFFCCVSCMVLMLKFRGFRASMNLSSWRKKENEIESSLPMTGAYRIHRDEFYGNGSIAEPPKKLTPSMVKLPPSSQPYVNLRPTKSTSDLTQPKNLPAHLNRSSNDVSLDPRGRTTSNREENPPPTRPNRKEKSQEKEQKKIEKQKLAEQKAREKAEAQEQARKDKIRKEQEKKAAQAQAKAAKAYKKKAPPIPQAPAAPLPPTTPHTLLANPLAMSAYSTNTLESSISRTSGPPPYDDIAESEDTNTTSGNSNPGNVTNIASGNSNPGNVSFSKPIDNPSWDLISQHRQQISRPATSAVQKGARKNMVLDLQYKLGDDDENNTDA